MNEMERISNLATSALVPARAVARTCRSQRSSFCRRKGIAIILVLAMIGMTMAVAYSMVRSQVAQLNASSGVDLWGDARNAALSGLSAALRRMSQANWSGSDSTLTGTLGIGQTFTATYTTGDDSLASTDPQAGDWPYRVTITSTGYAADSSVSAVPTTYRIQAVADLVPRKTATNPTMWTGMQSYVIYQTGTDNLSLQIPFRIEGAVRFQGSLTNFCTTYPSPSDALSRYLSDLNVMRTQGYADYRPFTLPISLPLSSTTSTVRSLLTSNLGVTLTDLASSSSSGWSAPNSMVTYQLYPGGKVYTIPTLASGVSGIALGPAPRTNPAGIFFRNGDVTFGSDTSIVGRVISTGSVRFSGTNIAIQACSLPALDGASTSNQLPAVVAA